MRWKPGGTRTRNPRSPLSLGRRPARGGQRVGKAVRCSVPLSYGLHRYTAPSLPPPRRPAAGRRGTWMGSPAGIEPATSGLAMSLHLRPASGRGSGRQESGAPTTELQGFPAGVASGARTHNPRAHDPMLRQLSYGHHDVLGLGRRKRSAFARGSRLSPGWGITPRRPVTPVAARSIHPPPGLVVPECGSPRPAMCAGGATWTRSL